MKARIKATGEIINVERYGDAYAEVLQSCSERSYPEMYEFDELEFITEPDWQQIHIQAAIAAMQGMLANPQTFEQLDHDERYKDIRGGDKLQIVAIASVMYANALIEELKKRGGQ